MSTSDTVLDPPDLVKAFLDGALAPATGTDPGRLARQIAADLDAFLARLIPAQPDPENPCQNPSPEIAPLCAARELALATSANAFQQSQTAAAGIFQTALNAWALARSNYQFNVTSADLALRLAVKNAVDIYHQKLNPDSKSRNQFLYFSLKKEVTTALQAFEASRAKAGVTLTAAAGEVMAAYTTYLTSAAEAQTTRQGADATAEATFWQNVEQVLDAE